jgi:hypothetical protein
MTHALSMGTVSTTGAITTARFVLRQGSGVFGLLLAIWGLVVGIYIITNAGEMGGAYFVPGAVVTAMGLFGVWMVFQSETFVFNDADFELSHFWRVTRLNYSEITDAKEILYKGRGDYAALGYSLEMKRLGKTFTFKVAARGSRASTDFMAFIKQKVKGADYHECDETDPDYVRTLWW